MEYETKKKKMVATLQSRRDILESKLREKSKELKKLCIQEAELTGILPPETPIEHGESPPVFRRKIGTAFTYSEALINKLKSKDEESITELEVQCKVLASISEAALALANDLSASKSIRRKHRLEYQQNQRRLSELEIRLTVLKQSIKSSNHLKQRKKPRPPLSGQIDCVDGRQLSSTSSHFNPSTLPSMNRNVVHNNKLYNNLGKSTPQILQPHQSSRLSWNKRSPELDQSYWASDCYEDSRNWPTPVIDNSSCRKDTAPIGYFSNQCYTTLPSDTSKLHSKYGSLDRRHRNTHIPDQHLLPNSRVSPVLPTLPLSAFPIQSSLRKAPTCTSTQSVNPPSDKSSIDSVLLPNQTYPENSLTCLTRTQSLDNVERCKVSLDTYSLQEKKQEPYQSSTVNWRNKENQWREIILNTNSAEKQNKTPPLHPRASKNENVAPQRPLSLRLSRISPPPPVPLPHSITVSPPLPPPPLFKSSEIVKCVPYESPKNQTVVEVGEWKPYREVVKPFEMSDFYKYSTKFKKHNVEQSRTVVDQNENREQNKRNSTKIVSLELTVSAHNNIDTNQTPNLNANFLKNITQTRHSPLSVVNNGSENINMIKHWYKKMVNEADSQFK